MNDQLTDVAEAYRVFARREARGRSAEYEWLAESVADDPAVVGFIASLPPDKRQPNFVFAAARYLLGVLPGSQQLRDLVRRSRPELTHVILTRRMQTNEPARCAVLLPALAQLPQPLALIEAGASAGLTLLFDRYSYDYAGHRLAGGDPDAPTLRCEPRGPVPLPTRIPVITWRAGLDLNPLDVTSEDDVRWLSCLVWPGEGDRGPRLEAAIGAARRDPPAVHRGDLLSDLPALAAQAPAGATLVIYHSSTLYYVAPDRREQFAQAVRSLGAVWLSSEAPGILPGTAAPAPDEQVSVIARDGRAIAFADSHGAWLQWLSALPALTSRRRAPNRTMGVTGPDESHESQRQAPDGSGSGGVRSWRRRTSMTCTPNAWNLARSPFRAPGSRKGPCRTVSTGSTEALSRSKSSRASGGRSPVTRIS